MELADLSVTSTLFHGGIVESSSSSLYSCEDPELYRNVTAVVNNLNNVTDNRPVLNDSQWYYNLVQYLVNKIVAPLICAFGIVGNLLNLVVLTRKRLQCSMDRMEKSSHVGLVALAVSDFLFCLFYLFYLVIPDKVVYLGGFHWLIGLYYSVYKEATINVFAMTSTWLTVVMAIGRYVVVCRPLHARGYISLRGTKASIGASFVFAVLLNVPRMTSLEIITTPCSELNVPFPENCSCEVFSKGTGAIYSRLPSLKFVYDVVWFIVAILVPLVILTACNVCLIRALRQSRRLQRLCRANNPSAVGRSPSMSLSAAGGQRSVTSRGASSGTGGNGSHNRITPTLVALIIVFIVCVGPSEMLNFLQPYIVFRHDGSSSGYYTYQTATVVTNCLFLVNFAANFILYCVVNVQFRRTVRDIICCAWKATSGQRVVGPGGRVGYTAGVGASRVRRGRGALDCSVGQSGVTGGRSRASLTYTVCTAIGSASCFDAAYLQTSSDMEGHGSVAPGAVPIATGGPVMVPLTDIAIGDGVVTHVVGGGGLIQVIEVSPALDRT